MKLKYKAILLLLLSAPLFSCTNWLELDPAGKIISGDYWQKESDVEASVLACYRAMLEDDYIARLIVYGEFRSDNIELGVTDADKDKDLIRIDAANILPENSFAKWDAFYKVINLCNVVIYYAPKVNDQNFTQAKLQAKLAEVLAIRALSYFYLVRAFDQVPYITEASLTEGQDYNIRKTSQAEILNNIEKDLLQAEAWALADYGATDATKGRITRNAIYALLADVYLWQNKYDQCITYCDKVLSDKNLVLIKPEYDPYYMIFGRKNSTESIFELQFSYIDNTKNNMIAQYYYNEKDGKEIGKFSASNYVSTNDKIFKRTPVITDSRVKDAINLTLGAKGSMYPIFKYSGRSRSESSDGKMIFYSSTRSQSSDPSNWIIYRLSDVMLMKAEALVEKNNFPQALRIVNTTYKRSNPTITDADTLRSSSYPDKKAMEDLVLLERQREFLFEGKRWFDLLRMARRNGNADRLIENISNKYGTRPDIKSRITSQMKDMNSLYFPISKDELNANSNLTQNPYYENK